MQAWTAGPISAGPARGGGRDLWGGPSTFCFLPPPSFLKMLVGLPINSKFGEKAPGFVRELWFPWAAFFPHFPFLPLPKAHLKWPAPLTQEDLLGLPFGGQRPAQLQLPWTLPFWLAGSAPVQGALAWVGGGISGRLGHSSKGQGSLSKLSLFLCLGSPSVAKSAELGATSRAGILGFSCSEI